MAGTFEESAFIYVSCELIFLLDQCFGQSKCTFRNTTDGLMDISKTVIETLPKLFRLMFWFAFNTGILSIQCPAAVSRSGQCGQGTTTVTFNAATPLNVLGSPSISYTSNSGSVVFNTQNPNQVTASFPVGVSTEVTATVTDSGRPFGQNTAFCTFPVLIMGGKPDFSL